MESWHWPRYRTNFLKGDLFELVSRYSDFFKHCPVLKAESDELRTSWLLLGIQVVERM